ncbi:unnamed protein product [Caenorhabditis angaria]|uniref:Bestrophin homolog n=1 Tax=Caenorhabditis angaria TaxID=860376 RepID=A0A9P1IIF4_9PELO|nr:unnamed protein product [Caenorhabditis angaria]
MSSENEPPKTVIFEQKPPPPKHFSFSDWPFPLPDVFKRKLLSYNYNYDLATSKSAVVFKLLFKWRGSLWQAIYWDLIIWITAYSIVSILYRFALSKNQKDLFERFGEYCDARMGYLPLNFVLGFFCNIIIRRWLKLFTSLGNIDNIALFVSAYVRGDSDRARQIRRNIIRKLYKNDVFEPKFHHLDRKIANHSYGLLKCHHHNVGAFAIACNRILSSRSLILIVSSLSQLSFISSQFSSLFIFHQIHLNFAYLFASYLLESLHPPMMNIIHQY